jgi:uncharacterized membrane protein YfcA
MDFTPWQYIELISIGIGIGGYGTLIGTGGGFALMPILLLMYPKQDPEQLTSISLAVVFLNAMSGSEAYGRMKRIDYRSGFLFAVAAVPGAILGALHTAYVSKYLFDILFGAVLIGAALFLMLHPKPAETSDTAGKSRTHRFVRRVTDIYGTRYTYSYNPVLGMAISFGIGYVSSFLGIGGGIIQVPALSYLLGFPVHVATATSHFMLAVMSLTATLTHVINGTFAHGVHRMIALGIGVVIGAQIGARFSNHFKSKWIIRSLATALILVGLRILVAAAGE